MTKLRPAFLIALLVAEVAAVISLRWLGLDGTRSGVVWLLAAIAVVLPLVIAAGLLIWRRGRFSLRALLVVVALFAVFLSLSAIPLIEFHNARRVSKQLLAAGASVRTNCTRDDFYKQLGFDPRPPFLPVVEKTPIWVKPLVREASAIPADKTVREIALNSDQQISILFGQPARFESLETLAVSRAITTQGLTDWGGAPPHFPRLAEVHVNSVVPPAGWIASHPSIRSLHVWGEGPWMGRPLPPELLNEILSVRNLQYLEVFGYTINDSDAARLGECKSLKFIHLHRTGITPQGEDAIKEALPDCVVHRN